MPCAARYIDSVELFLRNTRAVELTRSGRLDYPIQRLPAFQKRHPDVRYGYLSVCLRDVPGARVQSSMEERIRHGCTLRELLRRDRFEPQSIEIQLVWLVAFKQCCARWTNNRTLASPR